MFRSFVQGVGGGTATSAGLTLGPLLLAWPIASTLSGKVIIRFGYRFTAVAGTLLVAIGAGMLTMYGVGTTLPYVIVSMLVIGAGLGFMSMAFLLSVQNAVPWNLRGVATASNQFFRTMGGTVGVAVMGTILNLQMAVLFTPIFAQHASIVASLPKGLSPSNVLLTPSVRATLPTDFLGQLTTALAHSLFWLYALMLALAILGLVAVFFLPGGRAEQYAYHDDAGAAEVEQEATGEREAEITTTFG